MEITEKSSSQRGKLFSIYTILSSGKVLPIIILVVVPASAIPILYYYGTTSTESGILLFSVISIMVVLYAPYRAAYTSEKYFKRRGYGNVIHEYFVIKHILYFAIPIFIFLQILPLAPVVKITVDALLTSTFVSLLTYLSLWIVIAGLTKIILQVAKKEFRLNFAIGCIRFLAREEDEIDKMKYVIWGLDSYNAYLRRYLKLEIGNLNRRLYNFTASIRSPTRFVP